MFTEKKHKHINEQMYIGLGIQPLLSLRINLYHTKYFPNSIIMHKGDNPYPLRTAYAAYRPILALRTAYRHVMAMHTTYRVTTKTNCGRFHLHKRNK